MGLQWIAAGLDYAEDRGTGAERDAWRLVRREILSFVVPELVAEGTGTTVLTKGYESREWAVASFNRLARRSSARIVIDANMRPVLEARDPLSEALAILWRHLFDVEAWKRLKRCPQCRLWFVDTTKNRSQRWCSRKCSNRLWTRRYRRESHRRRLRQRQRDRRGRLLKFGRVESRA